jgi:hypothetical protein
MELVQQSHLERIMAAIKPYIKELEERKDPQLRKVKMIFQEFWQREDLVWLLRALAILEGPVKEKCFVLVVEAGDVLALVLDE